MLHCLEQYYMAAVHVLHRRKENSLGTYVRITKPIKFWCPQSCSEFEMGLAPDVSLVLMVTEDRNSFSFKTSGNKLFVL